MRRIALIGIAFFLTPLAVQAQNYGNPFPFALDTGFRFHMQLVPAGGPQLGPWYQYWPLEAHFQTPAPPAWPYWPQGQGGMGPGGVPGNMAPPGGGGPNVMGPQGPANFHAPQVIPVGYQRNVPSYWYR